MKDWTGTKNSLFKTLGAGGAHADSERELHDYYATHPSTIPPLLLALKKRGESLSKRLWENACGECHLSNELENHGFSVRSSDIIQRSVPVEILDFLNNGRPMAGADIITNPPFRYATEWVYRSLQCVDKGRKVVLFLKLLFLEGKQRRHLFEEHPPKYVFVFSARQICAMNGEFKEKTRNGSAACYAWFVWEKGYRGDTVIDWI